MMLNADIRRGLSQMLTPAGRGVRTGLFCGRTLWTTTMGKQMHLIIIQQIIKAIKFFAVGGCGSDFDCYFICWQFEYQRFTCFNFLHFSAVASFGLQNLNVRLLA